MSSASSTARRGYWSKIEIDHSCSLNEDPPKIFDVKVTCIDLFVQFISNRLIDSDSASMADRTFFTLWPYLARRMYFVTRYSFKTLEEGSLFKGRRNADSGA